MRIKILFITISWLPLTLLLFLLWDAGRMEGWGGWALAAAMGPPVILFSAAMGVGGVWLWFRERRRGNPAGLILLAALVAASPLFWFAARVFWLEIKRGF